MRFQISIKLNQMNKVTYNESTSIGGRDENQDFHGHLINNDCQLFVVCDGMGGHKGGQMAATLAVNTVIEYIKTNIKQSDPQQCLEKAITFANTIIWTKGQEDKSYEGMGATIVAILFYDKKVIRAHVGDSRIYHLRNGDLVSGSGVSDDHSLVGEMVKRGIITAEEALTHPKRNVINRALGIDENVEIEFLDIQNIQSGDLFILCSDGLLSHISNNEIVEFISQNNLPSKMSELLVAKADERGKLNGGKHDNITVTVLKIEQDISKEKTLVSNKYGVNTTPIETKKSIFNNTYLLISIGVVIGMLLVSGYWIWDSSKGSTPKPLLGKNNKATISEKKAVIPNENANIQEDTKSTVATPNTTEIQSEEKPKEKPRTEQLSKSSKADSLKQNTTNNKH